jgi:lipopolysaccharide biosynthesis regulator YciM
LLALANAHTANGEHTAALEVLERVRALHPRAPRVLEIVRDAYIAVDRWQDAVSSQESLVAEMRDSERLAREQELLTTLRYQASLQADDPAARAVALDALADRRTTSVPIAVSLGDALATAGRLDEAVAVWERGLKSTPRSVFVQRLADLASENKHRDRLCALIHKLRSDAVRPDNVRLLAAHLQLLNDRPAEAEKELDLIRDTDGAPSFLHHLRAQIHRRHGRVELALEELFKAGQRDPWGYRCVKCGHAGTDCNGRCPACGGWDTHRAAVEIAVD